MKILFLTLLGFKSFSEHNIYCDLLREFMKNGHEVFCISPTEKRFKEATHLEEDGHLLKLQIGNTQKTNVIEKGISTLMIEPQFKAAIKKYFGNIKFDLVLYSTPPITLLSAIEYVKKRDNAKTYLMLKDIFPQNAVDLGMMSKSGLKGLLYRYFRYKEKKLYQVSDHIGCMSQANVDYVLKHNAEVDPAKVEICPNSIEVVDMSVDEKTRCDIRNKYGVPLHKKVFIYGGNLGKPQGIDFMIECLKSQADNDKVYFVIVGCGTDFYKAQAYVNSGKQNNVKLMDSLPKKDYDTLVGACDVGLIFLDHRFTIPNFPSRLLSYMQAKVPVLALTDPNTDIGKVAVKGGFGWWCESNSVEDFAKLVDQILDTDQSEIDEMKEEEFRYLVRHYSSSSTYEVIKKRITL